MQEDERWTAWLAGLIEGEGTISLSRSNKIVNGRPSHPYIVCTFQVVNTNMVLLEKASDIFESICGFRGHLTVTNHADNCKTGYRVTIDAQKKLLVILPKIIPYLVSKREQAELVLAFCKRRNQRFVKKWYQFAEIDIAAWERCKELNRRGVVTVETNGGTPCKEITGEDRVRTTEESVEAAEMTARQLRLVI